MRDKEAWLNAAVAAYQGQLTRLCCVLLRDRQLAEDAVQDTFIKAYRALDGYRGEAAERTWLTHIAVNTCRDMTRTGWFRHTDRHVSPDMLPDRAALSQDEYLLDEALMKLPCKLREAVMLYYYQGMDTVETARALGISQPAVSARLKKARAQLREALEGRYFHV